MRYQFELENESGEEFDDEEEKDDTYEYDLEEAEEEKPFV